MNLQDFVGSCRKLINQTIRRKNLCCRLWLLLKTLNMNEKLSITSKFLEKVKNILNDVNMCKFLN